MMGDRLRLCAACNVPSPGPTKRLYYQHRDYGPFFPILEDQRRKSNGCLFSGGRVVVCTGCASHLLRQWATYDKNWTPLEKRSYTLLSEERMARKAKKDSLVSKVSMGTNEDTVELKEQETQASWKQTASKITSKHRALKAFNHEALSDKASYSSVNGKLSPSSFISEDCSPFRRAVKRVSKQNTRFLTEYNVTNKQSEATNLDTLEKQEQWNGEGRIPKTPNGVTSASSAMPRKRSLALWNLPSEDIRSKVREELQENIDVMIRKVAEIQHFENMRRYEQELKDAAQRMCRVQNRDSDIDHMCQNLKSQLQEELLFRDTLRVLKENGDEGRDVREENLRMSLEPPPATNLTENQTEKPEKINPNLTDVTIAKKAGKEWKGRAARRKTRDKAGESTQKSLALVPCPTEESPGTSRRSGDERLTSASRKLDSVVRELEKEREWRKRTENVIIQQREMIEELRNGIQSEVQRLIDEQNKRYHEIKANLVKYETPNGLSRRSPGLSRPGPNKNPYVSLDRTSPTDHDATRDHGEIMRSRGRRRQRGDRSRDDWAYKENVPSAAHNNDDDDDGSDDDDDISDDDDDSSPATPEFYIQ